MNAIETKYKGYRFRSRLEARWAVFLDALGTRWEYEKEGYDLGAAGWYLPDFWLPETGLWIEVKGADLDEAALRKGEGLRNATGAAVFLANGLPCEYCGVLLAWDTTDSSGGSYEDLALIESLQPNGALQFASQFDSRLNRDRCVFRDSGFETPLDITYNDGKYDPHALVAAAVQAAGYARFEHGERGAA